MCVYCLTPFSSPHPLGATTNPNLLVRNPAKPLSSHLYQISSLILSIVLTPVFISPFIMFRRVLSYRVVLSYSLRDRLFLLLMLTAICCRCRCRSSLPVHPSPLPSFSFSINSSYAFASYILTFPSFFLPHAPYAHARNFLCFSQFLNMYTCICIYAPSAVLWIQQTMTFFVPLYCQHLQLRFESFRLHICSHKSYSGAESSQRQN